MYRGHTIGVVVPAYNEEGFVGTVIDTMPDYVDRIYVVDDRSTDGTWDEILEHAQQEEQRSEPRPRQLADGGQAFDRRVVPIRHDENRGVGGAIKTGYRRALRDRVDVTAVMGGDGQMDPDLLDDIIDPVVEGEADYAKGNRLHSREYRRAMPRGRFVGNVLLSFLTKVASGYWKTMDPQNGYTAISSEALDAIELDEMYEFYGYCNDLLVKLNRAGLRVADVPMPAVYGDEESSISYSEYIPKVSGMLLRNFLWRLNTKYLVLDFHPLALFYYVGATLAGFGVLGLAVAGVQASTGGDVLGVLGLGAELLMGSVAFLLFAMVFDMRQNEHLEVAAE